MTMDVWADSVQTVAVALGAGAAIFAWRQVRLARHGGGGANILDLWGFLQSEVARSNRRILYQTASTKGPFVASTDIDGPHSWDADEIEAALYVAQICSTVGALAKHDYVPLEILQDEWGSMIVRTWGLVEPLMRFERERRNDASFHANYEWLARKCGFIR